MVRLIVGTVLRVGQGRLAPAAVWEILGARRLAAAGPAVPARGLYLVRVTYE
jgi:tRNA pseudouridine38-40 synthase